MVDRTKCAEKRSRSSLREAKCRCESATERQYESTRFKLGTAKSSQKAFVLDMDELDDLGLGGDVHDM